MQDPHPLAIIPLQRDLLLSDTSSNSSSTYSSPHSRSINHNNNNNSSSTSNTSVGGNLLVDAPLVPVRALVPLGENSSTAHQPSLRSEDDAALMRSLISLLPHEQADSQVRGHVSAATSRVWNLANGALLDCTAVPLSVVRSFGSCTMAT